MVILDTNVIIDHLRLKGNDSYLFKLSEKFKTPELGISVISIEELYEGKSTTESEAEQFLVGTIAPLIVFSYTYEVAKFAGELIRNSKIHLEFADAAIAATAIFNEASLATLNKKDFQGIKDLELL